MSTRAYSLNRPIGLGTYPKPEHGDWEIENWHERRFVDGIRRWAWGYVDYEADMDADELDRYDMMTEDMAPKAPPERVVMQMARKFLEGRDAAVDRMFDKLEADGYDDELVGLAFDDAVAKLREDDAA